MSLYSDFFYSAEVSEIFSDKKTIGNMLEVEAALAKSQAENFLISEEIAKVISGCCNIEMIDVDKLKKEIKFGGNAAIPLVQQLTKVVKNNDFEASKFVHFGATSQDIIDTATVLQIRDFINWLDLKIIEIIASLIKLAEKHKSTLMIGRTLLQQAKPITFGLKVSGWLESISRSKTRLYEMKSRLYSIQLSGAVGSQNTKISNQISKSFAEYLKLNASYSWQAHRDNFSELASNLAILVGSLSKIAKDISLLMQTEVGEVLEGAADGKGGSSTMPHKRNPVTSAAILANGARVPNLLATMLSTMSQEHERSAGLWHAEWEVLVQIMELTGGCLEKSVDLVSNLEVNSERMLQNLEITKGLIYAENVSLALTPKMGKISAHEFIEKSCKLALVKNKHLKDILIESKIEIQNLEALFDPRNSIGNSESIVEEIITKIKALEIATNKA
jgi:3-carboxy-cis,cis-muconate cycloisomerase